MTIAVEGQGKVKGRTGVRLLQPVPVEVLPHVRPVDDPGHLSTPSQLHDTENVTAKSNCQAGNVDVPCGQRVQVAGLMLCRAHELQGS